MPEVAGPAADALSDLEVAQLLGTGADPSTAILGDEEHSITSINWRQLDGEPPPREWWITDWLTTAPTLLAGCGGIGKSMVAQCICTALAAGCEYLAPASRPLRTMLWACEDDMNELWRRQVSINRRFGIGPESLDNLFVVPRAGRNNTLYADRFGRPVETPLMSRLQQARDDRRIDVLVLDTLAHVFGARSENQAHVTAFVNRVFALGRDRPFAPILVGHPSRAEGSEFSGSAAWENAVRSRWYLGTNVPGHTPDTEVDSDSKVIYLSRRKANYAANGYVKLTYDQGVPMPEDRPCDPAARAERLARQEQVVIQGFRRINALGLPASEAISSPNYLPKKLIEMQLHDGAGRRELGAALARVIADGRLERRVVGKHHNGSVRAVLTEPF